MDNLTATSDIESVEHAIQFAHTVELDLATLLDQPNGLTYTDLNQTSQTADTALIIQPSQGVYATQAALEAHILQLMGLQSVTGEVELTTTGSYVRVLEACLGTFCTYTEVFAYDDYILDSISDLNGEVTVAGLTVLTPQNVEADGGDTIGTSGNGKYRDDLRARIRARSWNILGIYRARGGDVDRVRWTGTSDTYREAHDIEIANAYCNGSSDGGYHRRERHNEKGMTLRRWGLLSGFNLTAVKTYGYARRHSGRVDRIAQNGTMSCAYYFPHWDQF